MADLFDEVEEQLRSDRYRTLALKALPWVLGLAAAAVIAVLGWWGWTHYRDQAVSQASDQYAAAIEAVQKGQNDQAASLFTEVSKSSAKGYRSLALMQLGGLQLAQKNVTAAVQSFDQAAAAAPDETLGDAARLRAVYALLDTAPEKDVEARLTPLMQDGRPYRVQAREAQAFAKLLKGDSAGARGDFVVISQSLDAPETARQRAKAAMDLIDTGSAKSVPAVVKAAESLPAPMLVGPGGVPMGPAPQGQAQGQPQAPAPQ